MNREFLKDLGIEQEAIDKIMAENGKDIEKAKGSADQNAGRVKELEAEVKSLKGSIDDRDKQLEDLKKAAEGSDQLKAQIEQLTKDNKAASEAHEAEMAALKKTHAIEAALSQARAKAVKAVAPYIDTDKVDFDSKVIFIHPAQEATLLKDSAFTSADKFEAGVAVNGSVGKITGCWVKKSKKVKLIKYEKDDSGSIEIVDDATNETSTKKHLATIQPNCAAVLAIGDKVSAAAADYYLNPILKMQPDSPETEYTEDELPAITVYLKKDTQLDAEWIPRFQHHELTVAKYYGVAKTNDSKIVLAKFKE